jgi:hypothetical protein
MACCPSPAATSPAAGARKSAALSYPARYNERIAAGEQSLLTFTTPEDDTMRCSVGPIQFALPLLAVTVLIAATSLPAQGLVEYEFTGEVTDNTGNLGVFGQPFTVQVGQPFTGRFSYMTGLGNPDQLPADAELGTYNLVDFQLDQAVVPITPLAVVITHRAGLPTLFPLPPDPGLDRLSVVGTFPFDDGFKVVSLSLSGPYESVFPDDSLPLNITLGEFTDAKIVQSVRVIALAPDGQSQIDAGQLASLMRIPEPNSLLLAFGCLTIASLVPRRSRLGNVSVADAAPLPPGRRSAVAERGSELSSG